jgi:hypothetical protein
MLNGGDSGRRYLFLRLLKRLVCLEVSLTIFPPSVYCQGYRKIMENCIATTKHLTDRIQEVSNRTVNDRFARPV